MIYVKILIVKKKWLSETVSSQLSVTNRDREHRSLLQEERKLRLQEKRFAFYMNVFYNTYYLNLHRKTVSISPHGKPSKSF